MIVHASRPRIGVRLLAVCLLPAAAFPFMAHAQQVEKTTRHANLSESPGFFYDLNGKRTVLEANNEFLVRMQPGLRGSTDPTTRPTALPAAVLPDHLPASARYLEDRLARRGLFVVRNLDRASVESLPGVEYALPLLYRPGIPTPIYQTPDIVLRAQPGMDFTALTTLAASVGCDLRPAPRGNRRYILTVRDVHATQPLAVANLLHEMHNVTEYAQPDFFLPKVACSPPVINDPYYLSLQWHLDGDVSKGADPNSDINVETAWDTDNGPNAQGVSTVRVSILDECVERDHPDLLPNFWAGLDLDNDPPDSDPSPDAGQRHGTSCAGVAVAKGNSIGVRGAAPECGLIGVKFFGATISEMADGYYFSVDPDNNGDHSDGAAVLSNSWGFADGTLLPPDIVNAINFAANSGRNGKGCLVLFAAANNDHTVNGVQSLGQLPTVMAIGGTNSHAKHTEFSDVGPEVGIAAPTNDRGDDGVREPWLDITTVDNQGTSGYNGLPDLDYTNAFGGTSSATPLAAGVCALIISQDETMTAAQARAILQHTAVRIDEPYGRFDGITSHSDRLGYGRCDAGNAVTAAVAGMRWPDRAQNLNAVLGGSDITLTWGTPPDDYAESLLVRADHPFAWTPTDGQTYAVNDIVTNGVKVVYQGFGSIHVDTDANSGGLFYAVYPRSSADLYGFGAKTHIFLDPIVIFSDNSEGADPGWTHAGPGDEWTRGTPTSYLSAFSQAVGGSGPLAGLNGVRAIGGDKCWGTDLVATYDPDADAYLQTPLINLTGVTAPVFLEYYDWCLLETFYDHCTVEVVDANENFLGYLDPDTGGDYDWTQRVCDVTPYAGQAIKIRFRIASDGLLQRDGWFIDNVRVIVAGNVPLPPTASDIYVETTENTPINAVLVGADPNPLSTLSFVVNTLPLHGTLFDPQGPGTGEITGAPYTLANNGATVSFEPDLDYQGPDAFTYQVSDGALLSNTANVDLSIGTPTVAYDFPLDTDPDWLTEGKWAFGIPLGVDGDPTSGLTGLNVYGYNLAGAYEDDLPPTHLVMQPFNCTGLSRVTLNFARWLGVEAGSYDNASIEASNDGTTWTTIWSYTGDDLEETVWSMQSYNIGAVADDQPFVQVRWTMGPTDGGANFAGWNVDDVQISAIGTPAANQPPFAKDIDGDTAKDAPVDLVLDASDADLDPLDFVIVDLPTNGALYDPNGGQITAAPYTLSAGGNTVHYEPDIGFAGFDSFDYHATDGALDSNIATGTIHVIDSAPFPYVDDFEAGPPLVVHWFAESTNVGRIRVTDEGGPDGAYHVTLDSGSEGAYSLNELTLAIDLEGASNVLLQYDWKDFGDESNTLPASWTGSSEGDGVAISADGQTWYKVADLFDPAALATTHNGEEPAGLRADTYQTVTLDLDAAAAAAGISYNDTFRIRFQQYDNYPIDADGIAIDNVGVLQGTDDPLIVTSSLPVGRVGEAYGPTAVQTIGGDHPLIWDTPVIFNEQSLGALPFTTNGVAQGWHGDDVVFDYTLPFSFEFYGAFYTDLKIATDGWINFGSYVGSTYNNSEGLLAANKRIAVIWDDLRTDIGASDVYIDESTPGQVTIRWDAVTRSAGNQPCNFSATLFDTGRIRLDYGSGNTPLTPTVGVSAGDEVRYFLTSYDALADLGNADSLLLDFSRLPPGLTMDTNGVVSGTPTEAGSFEPIFSITDQSARTDSRLIPMSVIDVIFGDFDQDGDVDYDDLVWFVDCMEQSEASEDCRDTFDDNVNLAIDLGDFARFQRDFSP